MTNWIPNPSLSSPKRLRILKSPKQSSQPHSSWMPRSRAQQEPPQQCCLPKTCLHRSSLRSCPRLQASPNRIHP
ncbi:hypothetical protein SAMN05421819_2391 [Bryocella elongata]|uniref:Uncharacterized protein n=1 Tax=Bryocella elongata TaxID=863522 RepID=A0A1H5YMD6_9BACT|nr:hypothetical protein SAMN05421819_2391 [Bryocella elongata]